ncbi:MAG: hypothetical protein IJM12_01845 [Bacteroidales bacterium]|nr:hypothetical protein [Bacteroidales bacterium]
MDTDSRFDSTYLFRLIYKHRKKLIILLLITAAVAAIVSSPLFIEPKYKSQLILFPSSSNSISKSLLTEQVNIKQDILQYGEDEQIDQMLQILNSTRIRDKIIERFDLLNHYGYANSKYKYTKLNDSYKKNIKCKRTEFSAVSVTVLDKDPQMAADIANTIGEIYDSTCNEMQKDRAMQAFKIVEKAYLDKVNDIREMEDSLAVLRSLGVNDYETQSEMVNEQLAIVIAKGDKRAIKDLQEQVEILAKYGTPYVSLRDQLEYDKLQLSEIKAKYDEAKVDAEQILPQKFIVSHAYKAERKSYPIRWLIVLLSMLAVFIFAVFVIIFMERVPGEIQREREEETNKTKNNLRSDNLQEKRETENTDKGKKKLDERRDSL